MDPIWKDLELFLQEKTATYWGILLSIIHQQQPKDIFCNCAENFAESIWVNFKQGLSHKKTEQKKSLVILSQEYLRLLTSIDLLHEQMQYLLCIMNSQTELHSEKIKGVGPAM